MSVKKYKVTLTDDERGELTALVNRGKGNARHLRRARMLLMADEAQAGGGFTDAAIAKALSAQVRTVERVRRKCVDVGLEAALNHARPKKTRPKVFDGVAEAYLSHLACTEAPDGHERWSLQMLADELVRLEVVETVSYETVRTTLKKMNLSLG